MGVKGEQRDGDNKEMFLATWLLTNLNWDEGTEMQKQLRRYTKNSSGPVINEEHDTHTGETINLHTHWLPHSLMEEKASNRTLEPSVSQSILSLLFLIPDLLVPPSESLKTLWTGLHPLFSQILAIAQPLSSDKLAAMCWPFPDRKTRMTSCPAGHPSGDVEEREMPLMWFGKAGTEVSCLLSGSLLSALCDPMDCSLPGSPVHGLLQVRILEWIAISYSRESSWPRDRTHTSCVPCTDRWLLYHWATSEDSKYHREKQRMFHTADFLWKELLISSHAKDPNFVCWPHSFFFCPSGYPLTVAKLLRIKTVNMNSSKQLSGKALKASIYNPYVT